MKVKRYRYEQKVNSIMFFEKEQMMSCICGLLEGAGWLCVHMFTVMKYCNLSAIPHKFLNSRWSKHMISGERITSDMPISITQMGEIRFGLLHRQCL